MAKIRYEKGTGLLKGRVGKGMVYYVRRGTPCVRQYVKPRNPDTPGQKLQRGRFGEAVLVWRGLTEKEKELYRERAKWGNLTGYNLFISEFLKY